MCSLLLPTIFCELADIPDHNSIQAILHEWSFAVNSESQKWRGRKILGAEAKKEMNKQNGK